MQILQSRSDLEQQSIETSNTSEAVGLITYVQSLKRKMKSWEKQVDMYKEGQRLLERQRFQFPSAWLYSDNIEGEWSAFSDIIRRKDLSIQTQVASLQMKVISEDKLVESRTTELISEWEKEKPVEVRCPCCMDLNLFLLVNFTNFWLLILGLECSTVCSRDVDID